jgi:hypothetical protein
MIHVTDVRNLVVPLCATVCVSVAVRNIVACFIDRRYKFKGVKSNYVLFARGAQNEPMMAKCLFVRRFRSETTEPI